MSYSSWRKGIQSPADLKKNPNLGVPWCVSVVTDVAQVRSLAQELPCAAGSAKKKKKKKKRRKRKEKKKRKKSPNLPVAPRPQAAASPNPQPFPPHSFQSPSFFSPKASLLSPHCQPRPSPCPSSFPATLTFQGLCAPTPLPCMSPAPAPFRYPCPCGAFAGSLPR